jgi:very-short-patch-repair endonuclease
MIPSLASFIESFEEEAGRSGRYRVKIGHAEYIFLERVWGPVFQFKFDGLHAEYPFKDSKGGDRFVDFMYEHGGIRLIIEIDGYTTHARNISPGDFEDHLDRQNDLLLSGWFLLRFSARQVEHQSEYCRSKLQQALGNRWVQSYGILAA